MFSWLAMCASYTALTFALVGADRLSLEPIPMHLLSVVSMVGVICAFAIGPGCIAWFVVAEIFPL